jgi:trk system potassium uptake protein TrkA
MSSHRKRQAEFAVIGLGRFGASLALTLASRGFHVLGIDRDVTIVQRVAEQLTQVVQLDSTDEAALSAVDITSFDVVIVAIGSNFEANLLTTAALHALKVKRIICKALNERQRTILLRVGAEKVILPEFEAGARLALELVAPGMVGQIQLGDQHNICELTTPRSLIGQTILESDLRRRYGVTVLAVKRGDVLTVSPPPDFAFAAGDVLAIIGENNCTSRVMGLE